jgi:hypothetical protein
VPSYLTTDAPVSSTMRMSGKEDVQGRDGLRGLQDSSISSNRCQEVRLTVSDAARREQRATVSAPFGV